MNELEIKSEKLVYFKGLVREQGVSVIMITHNPAFSVIADRLILMSGGSVVEDIRQPFPLSADVLKLR